MINKLKANMDAIVLILSLPPVRKALEESDLRDLDSALASAAFNINWLEAEIENTKSFILAKSAELMEYVND